MSSENYPTLKLDLVPSRIVLASLAACHLLALIMAGLLVLPLIYKVGLVGLIIMSLIHTYTRLRSVHKSFISEIRYSDGGWLLCTATGESRPARLAAAFVHPCLVILRFHGDTVLIAPDSAAAAQLRRLRMHLLVAGEKNNGAEAASEF